MRGVLLLSLRHAMHHRVQTGILIVCIAVAIILPVTTHRLINRYERELGARSDSTPLIAGKVGNRFDLTMATLYFRLNDIDPLMYGQLKDVDDPAHGVAVPVHVRHTARDYPVVGTSIEYFEQRQLKPSDGSLPVMLGDVVLGATVARTLRLGVGDALFSDQKELYDISKPPALKMHVRGVLGISNTADDEAVFVDLNTAWLIDGHLHGHDDAESIEDETLLYGRAEDRIVLSEKLMQFNEVTGDNIGEFHFHGERDQLPLTAVLFFPRDARSGTIVKARINAGNELQMLVPRQIIDELLSVVFRIRAMLDGLYAVLAGSTALMAALVLMLSIRLRKNEMETLHRIGCSRFVVAGLYICELAAVIAVSVAISLGGSAAAAALLPRIIDLV